MAQITIGDVAAPVTASGALQLTTWVERRWPANLTGIIDTVNFYAFWDITGLQVGIFYIVAGNNLSTRSSAALGNFLIGQHSVSGLSLAVEPGDYIGYYTAAGRIGSGAMVDGSWSHPGDMIPATNHAFTLLAGYVVIGGTGTVPVIDSLTPSFGAIGSACVIDGEDFEAVQGTGGVTVNGVAAVVTAWADTQITITIPVGAASGNVVVTNNSGGVSDGFAWVLSSGRPNINSLTPNSGAIGDVVTISGTSFGVTEGSLWFNGARAVITSWNDTTIVTTVPSGARTGDLVVVSASGLASNVLTMAVTDAPPTVIISNPTGDDEYADFYACIRLGQFFVPVTTMEAQYIKVKGKKTGDPGYVTFEIHAADGNGLPTGPLLGQGSTNSAGWTVDTTGSWVLVPVTVGVRLSAGQSYTLTWYAPTGDNGNKGGARRKSTGTSTGNALYSIDCGINWVTEPAPDYVFEVIGVAPSTIVSRPTGGARAAVGFAPIG